MTRRGAINAAKMHGLLAGRAAFNWTAADWREHIAEEEKFFRPLLVEHFPMLVPVYDEDHRVFLFELDQYGAIRSTARLEAHSHMEDVVSVELVEMGY